MNSVEVAQKLIDENDKDIEFHRSRETEIRKRIEELEKKVENQMKALDILRDSLAREQQYLEEVQEDKFEYLVDNLALKAFIADGGGLDMFVN